MTVATLWNAYVEDHAGRAVIGTMRYTWRALESRFGRLQPQDITKHLCRQHTAARRAAGIKDGTIHTELGHLRMVLLWAAGQEPPLIARAPAIERPPKPEPMDRHLTREEAKRLIRAASFPHIRLYVILALGTAARNGALLGLTWERVDFERGRIMLRDPEMLMPAKGRAIVPMNRSVRAALLQAKAVARTPYVIEWAGQRVASVKRGLAKAAKDAGLQHVSPHMLRHTAAVHMAEAGVRMEEISQYLGHRDVEITRQVYARYSPEHLAHAARVLEYDDLAPAGHGDGHGNGTDGRAEGGPDLAEAG